jgi:competence protein ComEA
MPTPDATVTNGTADLSPEALDLLRRLRRGELVPAPGWEDADATTPEPAASTAEPATTSASEHPGAGEPRVRPPAGPRLADRLPPTLRDAVLDPSARGAAGLGIVALLAALVAVVLTVRAAPSSVPISAAPTFSGAAPAPSAGGAGLTAPAGRPLPSASALAEIVVDVAGKVRNPGVVSVPAGGRVADAIRRAGGVLPGTDTSALSLARKVTDGEQILVTGEPGPAPAAVPAPGGTSGGSAAPSGAADPAAAGPLDLNTATPAQLEELPGVGPVLAERIVAFRTEHNGFSAVDQLAEIKGLGGKTGQELMGLVRVG